MSVRASQPELGARSTTTRSRWLGRACEPRRSAARRWTGSAGGGRGLLTGPTGQAEAELPGRPRPLDAERMRGAAGRPVLGWVCPAAPDLRSWLDPDRGVQSAAAPICGPQRGPRGPYSRRAGRASRTCRPSTPSASSPRAAGGARRRRRLDGRREPSLDRLRRTVARGGAQESGRSAHDREAPAGSVATRRAGGDRRGRSSRRSHGSRCGIGDSGPPRCGSGGRAPPPTLRGGLATRRASRRKRAGRCEPPSGRRAIQMARARAAFVSSPYGCGDCHEPWILWMLAGLAVAACRSDPAGSAPEVAM
jgi:hypothetical protein